MASNQYSGAQSAEQQQFPFFEGGFAGMQDYNHLATGHGTIDPRCLQQTYNPQPQNVQQNYYSPTLRHTPQYQTMHANGYDPGARHDMPQRQANAYKHHASHTEQRQPQAVAPYARGHTPYGSVQQHQLVQSSQQAPNATYNFMLQNGFALNEYGQFVGAQTGYAQSTGGATNSMYMPEMPNPGLQYTGTGSNGQWEGSMLNLGMANGTDVYGSPEGNFISPKTRAVLQAHQAKQQRAERKPLRGNAPIFTPNTQITNTAVAPSATSSRDVEYGTCVSRTLSATSFTPSIQNQPMYGAFQSASPSNHATGMQMQNAGTQYSGTVNSGQQDGGMLKFGMPNGIDVYENPAAHGTLTPHQRRVGNDIVQLSHQYNQRSQHKGLPGNVLALPPKRPGLQMQQTPQSTPATSDAGGMQQITNYSKPIDFPALVIQIQAPGEGEKNTDIAKVAPVEQPRPQRRAPNAKNSSHGPPSSKLSAYQEYMQRVAKSARDPGKLSAYEAYQRGGYDAAAQPEKQQSRKQDYPPSGINASNSRRSRHDSKVDNINTPLTARTQDVQDVNHQGRAHSLQTVPSQTPVTEPKLGAVVIDLTRDDDEGMGLGVTRVKAAGQDGQALAPAQHLRTSNDASKSHPDTLPAAREPVSAPLPFKDRSGHELGVLGWDARSKRGGVKPRNEHLKGSGAASPAEALQEKMQQQLAEMKAKAAQAAKEAATKDVHKERTVQSEPEPEQQPDAKQGKAKARPKKAAVPQKNDTATPGAKSHRKKKSVDKKQQAAAWHSGSEADVQHLLFAKAAQDQERSRNAGIDRSAFAEAHNELGSDHEGSGSDEESFTAAPEPTISSRKRKRDAEEDEAPAKRTKEGATTGTTEGLDDAGEEQLGHQLSMAMAEDEELVPYTVPDWTDDNAEDSGELILDNTKYIAVQSTPAETAAPPISVGKGMKRKRNDEDEPVPAKKLRQEAGSLPGSHSLPCEEREASAKPTSPADSGYGSGATESSPTNAETPINDADASDGEYDYLFNESPPAAPAIKVATGLCLPGKPCARATYQY